MIADKSKTTDPMSVSRALLHHINMTFPGTTVQRQDGVHEWRTKTIDSSPDTVTVSAPIYGLCGIVIGHYSITVPRSEAERLSITFPITLQTAETESDGEQS